jgi:exopolysaccharide production protein ExoZ
MATKDDKLGGGNRMLLLDCSRGIAAILVVIRHASINVARPLYFGVDPFHGRMNFSERGVDFFFVLSGFIIAYVHWFDLGNKNRVSSYLTKRFIRIYPILWVVAIPYIVMSLLIGSDVMPADRAARWEVIAGSLSLWPTSQLPVPSVVWTLKHEVLFYLIFALVLCLPRLGTAVLVAWGSMCIYHLARGFESNFLTDFLLNTYNLEFLAGVACGWYMRNRSIRFPLVVSLVGVALFCHAASEFEYSPNTRPWIANPTTGWQVLQFGGSSVLIILGLAQLDLRGGIVPPRWLALLGAASYSIYLIHLPVNSLTCRLLRVASRYVPVTPLQAFFGVVLGGVLAGVALHLAVEAPLLSILRKKLLPAGPRAAPGKTA